MFMSESDEKEDVLPRKVVYTVPDHSQSDDKDTERYQMYVERES